MIKSLFKHSTIYLTGLVLGKALTTIVWIILARIFLPLLFGRLVLYLTIVQLTTYFANFGLTYWYQKYLEHHQYQRSTLFNKILNARLVTLIISVLAISAILKITGLFNLFVSFLLLITLIPEALLMIADGYFLEQKKGFRVSLKSASNGMIILVALPLLKPPLQFEKAVITLLIAESMTTIWFFPWQEIKKFIFLPLKETVRLLRSSVNYAFLIFSSFFYARGDHLVISVLSSNYALGLYNSAYRYLEALALVPTALSHNLFPVSAKKKGVDFHSLIRITGLMIVFGLFTSIFIFFSSRFLILTLISEAYAEAILPLRIFSLVLFLFFINSPLSTVVQSSNLLKKFLPYGVGNTILNLILNILLVPRWGIVAAAWSMFATELTGLFINLSFVKKLYRL